MSSRCVYSESGFPEQRKYRFTGSCRWYACDIRDGLIHTLLSFFKKRFRKKVFYKKLFKFNSRNSETPQQNKTPLTCLVFDKEEIRFVFELLTPVVS
eukprot:sb/3478968/